MEAFLYQRALDRPTFDAMVAKLEAAGAVDNARSEAHLADLDAGALVDYAIHVVTNAGTLWRDVEPAQRAQLQAFLFPEAYAGSATDLFEPGEPVCFSAAWNQVRVTKVGW